MALVGMRWSTGQRSHTTWTWCLKRIGSSSDHCLVAEAAVASTLRVLPHIMSEISETMADARIRSRIANLSGFCHVATVFVYFARARWGRRDYV
eukprot:2057305-Pyramimonas_sp.AAC.1